MVGSPAAYPPHYTWRRHQAVGLWVRGLNTMHYVIRRVSATDSSAETYKNKLCTSNALRTTIH